MVVEDEGAYCPDDAVKGGDEGDDEQGWEGDAANVRRLGVFVVEAEVDAGFESLVARCEGLIAGFECWTKGGLGLGRCLDSEGRCGRGRLWLHFSDLARGCTASMPPEYSSPMCGDPVEGLYITIGRIARQN